MAYNLNSPVRVGGLKTVLQSVNTKINGLSSVYAPLTDFNTVKNKVDGIEAGAQVNKIESITIDGTAQTITGKAVALDLGNYALKSDIAAGIRLKGSVANFAALPADAEVGDMYNVKAAGGTDENGVAIKAGDNVVRTGTGWDNYGGTIDLSGYVEKVTGKQLSTNDYTTEEKTKLAAIEAGAQVNKIESIKLNGTALDITEKGVNIDTSGKMDKVSGAVAGNIATFGANGQIIDSNVTFATDAEIAEMVAEVLGA